MTPPTPQTSVSVASSAGIPLIWTGETEPGVHAPVGAGVQGVGTPRAAAVRMAQTPKDGILAMGVASLTVAAN